MATDELKRKIQQVIEDHVVTSKEFNEILEIAEADGRIDSEELALFKELHKMIIDKVVAWRNKT